MAQEKERGAFSRVCLHSLLGLTLGVGTAHPALKLFLLWHFAPSCSSLGLCPLSESWGRLPLGFSIPAPLWFPHLLSKELLLHFTDEKTEVQDIK